MSLLAGIRSKISTPVKIHIEDSDAVAKLTEAFSEKLFSLGLTSDRPRLIICIGTDRSTGDSLGPIVGSRLLELNHKCFKVLGTLENPVHATNLAEYLKIIEKMPDPFVIAVDACLGNVNNVGCINIAEGALKPGAGVNKLLPPVGNLHITGVVNVGGFMEYFVLQNTRLNTVMKMARIISEAIHQASKQMSGWPMPDFDEYVNSALGRS